MAWEWRVAALHHIAAAKPVETVSSKTMSPKMPTDSEIIPATGAARDFFFTRLEKILDERHFFGSPDMAPVVKRNLRAYFTRGTPTEQELNTLHGILTLFEQGKGLG
jgi:tRNA C32,U32 (ribose-2'-O)-methylase TrmJ